MPQDEQGRLNDNILQSQGVTAPFSSLPKAVLQTLHRDECEPGQTAKINRPLLRSKQANPIGESNSDQKSGAEPAQ